MFANEHKHKWQLRILWVSKSKKSNMKFLERKSRVKKFLQLQQFRLWIPFYIRNSFLTFIYDLLEKSTKQNWISFGLNVLTSLRYAMRAGEHWTLNYLSFTGTFIYTDYKLLLLLLFKYFQPFQHIQFINEKLFACLFSDMKR